MNKMNKMKRKIAVMLVFAAVFSMSGCANKNAPNNNTAKEANASQESANGEIEISGEYEVKELADAEFTFFQYSVENHDNFKKLIDKYNEVHPNIKINLETVGGGADWKSALKAKIAGGEEPTMMMLEGPADFENFGDMLSDLGDQPWVEHMYDSMKPEVTVDGKIVACPYAIVNYGLVYNKRIFEAAGIDASTLNSYDAIDKAFGELKTKIDNGELKEQFPQLEAVCELPAKETWVIAGQGANIAFGQEFASASDCYNAKEIAFPYADQFKQYLDLQIKYTKNADNPEALNAVDYAMALGGGFAIERVAVLQMGQWIIPEVESIDPDLAKNIGLLPMPLKGVAEDTICYGGGAYLIINRHSAQEQQDAAKDFLNYAFMSDGGKDTMINDMNGNVPFDNISEYPVQNVIAAAGNDYATAGKVTPLVFGGFPIGWQEDFGADLQSYIAGKMSWEDVIQNAKDNWKAMRQ